MDPHSGTYVAIPPPTSAEVRDGPAPAYPRLSIQLGEQGEVVLRIAVGVNGDASSVRVERSSGHARLDEAAREAVRSWRFQAATLRGQPVESTLRHRIVFRLEE